MSSNYKIIADLLQGMMANSAAYIEHPEMFAELKEKIDDILEEMILGKIDQGDETYKRCGANGAKNKIHRVHSYIENDCTAEEELENALDAITSYDDFLCRGRPFPYAVFEHYKNEIYFLKARIIAHINNLITKIVA